MRKKRLAGKITMSVLCSAMVLNSAMYSNLVTRQVVKAEETDEMETAGTVKVTVNASEHSIFNDTNNDGFGEFQGFGTSLCWWANRVGYDKTLTDKATTAFYDEQEGLGLKIGRYNIGGGDDPSHNHIKRSDSVVPGYATDITKITSKEEAKGFAQYDLDCGYAWNYDWDADKNQLNVLYQAAKKAGEGFLAEAFANSPPYFMTKSGCSSGGVDGADNLREDSYKAFVKYLTDVTRHLKEEGYDISSITAMNEPSNGWTAFSNKQEGCKIEEGENTSRLVTELSNRLDETGMEDLVLSGCDYGGTFDTKSRYVKMTEEAKKMIERMDVHCYNISNSSAIFTRETAEQEGKNFWMSEVDGSYKAGEEAGEMTAALGLSKNVSSQLNLLRPAAWILWNAIDIHVDANNEFDADDMSDTYCSELDSKGFWGIAVANHNDKTVNLTKKYYGYGQYTRFIKQGTTIVDSSSDNKKVSVTTAYDNEKKETILVLTNMFGTKQNCQIDLSSIPEVPADASVGVVRTSGTMKDGENWANVTDFVTVNMDNTGKQMSVELSPNSITTVVIGSNVKEQIDKDYPSESTIEVPKTTIKSVKKLKSGTIKVQWKKADHVDGYKVIIAKNKAFTKGKKTYDSPGNKKYTMNIKKQKKGTYYIKVCAYVKDLEGIKHYGTCKKTKKIKIE